MSKPLHSMLVTGTHTGIGKTVVSAGLLHHFKQQGFSTLGLKPIASGCEHTSEGLRNSDALLLQKTASIKMDYPDINPYAFEPPIAPHIAAQKAKQTLSINQLLQHHEFVIKKYQPECSVTEGCGGLKVPLNPTETFSDFIQRLNIPVILVVGLTLGCLNHSLLSYESLSRANIPLLGWVANQSDKNMLAVSENISYLKRHLPIPLLASIPYLNDPHPATIAHFFSNLEEFTGIK